MVRGELSSLFQIFNIYIFPPFLSLSLSLSFCQLLSLVLLYRQISLFLIFSPLSHSFFKGHAWSPECASLFLSFSTLFLDFSLSLPLPLSFSLPFCLSLLNSLTLSLFLLVTSDQQSRIDSRRSRRATIRKNEFKVSLRDASTLIDWRHIIFFPPPFISLSLSLPLSLLRSLLNWRTFWR